MKATELKGKYIVTVTATNDHGKTNDVDGWRRFRLDYVNEHAATYLDPKAVRKAMRDYGFKIVRGGWQNGKLESTVTAIKIG